MKHKTTKKVKRKYTRRQQTVESNLGKCIEDDSRLTATEVYSQRPSWLNHKTKESAWRGGFNEGRISSLQEKDRDENSKLEQLQDEERRHRLQALRDVCEVGSRVVEAMSKALLSYDRNL